MRQRSETLAQYAQKKPQTRLYFEPSGNEALATAKNGVSGLIVVQGRPRTNYTTRNEKIDG